MSESENSLYNIVVVVFFFVSTWTGCDIKTYFRKGLFH